MIGSRLVAPLIVPLISISVPFFAEPWPLSHQSINLWLVQTAICSGAVHLYHQLTTSILPIGAWTLMPRARVALFAAFPCGSGSANTPRCKPSTAMAVKWCSISRRKLTFWKSPHLRSHVPDEQLSVHGLFVRSNAFIGSKRLPAGSGVAREGGRPRRSARQGPLGRNNGPRRMDASASSMVRGDGRATQLRAHLPEVLPQRRTITGG